MNNPTVFIARFRINRIFALCAAVGILLLVVLFSIATGTVDLPLSKIFNLLRGAGNGEDRFIRQILFNVRIPRVITGVLVGMNLAVAGVLLQGLLRNPITSPNIIGVNAGAGFAAVIIMTLFPGEIVFLPVAAFLGALCASLLIYALAMQTSGRSSTVHIVLAGVAISALLRALTSALMMINSDVLDVTYSWLLGSLSGRSWISVQSLWPYSAVALSAALLISPKVNLFGLGEEMGSSIGLRVGLYRLIIILTSSVLAGSAVSVAGTIGFVGLIAPHTARLLVGADHRYLIPLSAIIGAILLVLSDTVARIAFQPVEISVGIVTSVIGAPFFLLLLILMRKNRFD